MWGAGVDRNNERSEDQVTDNPWEPFEKLIETVRDAVAPLGLTPEHWFLMPGVDPNQPKGCQIVFRVDPDTFTVKPEEIADEDSLADINTLESIWAVTNEMEQRERVEKSKRRAAELADEISKGFLDGSPGS